MSRKSENVTTPERSRLMASVRQSGTAFELAVRKIVDNCGANYETNVKDLPGSPDLVNREEMWAIFAHGCFWHAHKGCKLCTIPKTNQAFWRKKFLDNRQRDKKKIDRLEKMGYSVLVVWQCELENKKKLEKKICGFLKRFKSMHDNQEKTKDKRSKGRKKRQAGGVGEEFEYSKSKKSVTRVVRLTDGQKFSTQIRIDTMGLNGEDAQSTFDYAFLRKRNSPIQLRSSQTVRVVDLFCGCGGLSLGAMEACRAVGKNFLSIAAVDNDLVSLEVYKRNLGCSKTYSQDVENLLNGTIGSEPTDNERNFLNEIKNVNILLAGPPCQGYSDLNNQTRRNDPRNILYERVARFVEISQPEHVLIENVSRATHGKEKAVQRSIDVIRELGYEVDSGIVDLAAIGVPQKRKRHIVIASTSKPISISEVIEKHRVEHYRSVKWAIGDLEDETPNGIFTTPSQLSKENMERIKYLHRKKIYYLPNRLRPPCHKKGDHTYWAMYSRIKPDEPSQTITSGFSSPGQGRFVHPTRLRTLTPHEAARLQFFPDFFDFSPVKSRKSLSSMIGNAVPMKLSYVFCLELLA